MFEKILEKVLLNNVGQFIDGIDKNNLKIGIWSGDIVIKDIAVKPEVIAMLDIPVKMMFSYVGKLSVSVPWKSLGSKPVEIALEDVYVILEPLDQNSWKGIDYKSVSKRLELMESFVQSYMTKLAEKAALENKDAKKEDQGMVARLTERVIDNIQITVRNIHVRFENPLSKRKYAWGITLDEILVYTTNNKWEREFVDRTESKNSLEPMRKMLSLKNLGVYWASDVPQLFAHMSAQNIKQFMKELILNDKTDPKQKLAYIIAISATCKLTQKNKKDPATASLPEFDVSLNLKPLNLQLKKPQLEDVIRLLEFMNGYQRFKLQAMKEREKEVAALTAEDKEKMKAEFTDLFGRIHRSEKAKDLKGEPKVVAALEVESDVDKFNNLVMSMPDEDLSVIIKDVVREVEKERRTKALEAQKASQTEKKGWFGWGSSKKTETSQSTQLDAEDQAAIEKAIEEAFGGEKEEDTAAKLEQLAYQPLFSISFTLEGGDFYFSNITPQNNEEGVTLSYKGLSAKIDVNSKGQSVNVTLKDYGVYLRTRYAGTTTYTDTPIIRRLNHWMPPEAAGNMISLLFEQNPQGREEGTYINLDSQAAEIVFRPVAIERLVSFFDVSTEDEALKTRALQVKEKYQDQASQAASQAVQSNAKKNISIKFAAPVLVIPFLQNADIQSECWVINLGDLRVNTQDEETKLYERFALGLENLTFQYYPSQSLYMKVMRSLKEKGDLSELKEEDREEQCRIFNLIQQFNIAINVDKMIAGVETRDEAKNKPRMNVDITIPSIDLQLNPLMYKNLLRTGEFVSYSKESAMELMETERTKLMAGNFKIGLLYVRETRLRDIVWTKYMCIFKGAYLYFFKNPTDPRPAFTYYIRDATVTQRNDLDRPNAFVVENRKNTGYLAGEDEKHMNEWLTVLHSKIQEYSAVNANVFDTGKLDQSVAKPKTAEAEPAEKIDYDVLSMSLVFQIKEVKLALFRKPDVKLFDLDTKNFVVNLRQQPGAMEVKLGLESLDIVDYIIEYQNPSLRKLVTSVPTGTIEGGATNADLIEIHVKTLDKTHPNYGEKKTDLEVTMKFGYLFVNLKPNTLSETMKFFLSPPDGGDQKKVEKVEKVEVKKAQGQDEIIYTQGTDHTMLRLNVEMKEVSLKLIHKKTHVCMAELALKNTSLSVKMKPLSMEVEGVLGNIQLFDTTNYPNTIDSNVEWEKIVPYEMIGVGAESKHLLDLKFKSLDPRNPEADNENKIYSYVDVKISSIRINLLQQPLLRLIDYLSGQLLPSLKAGDDSSDAAKQVVVTLDKETAEKTLANPQFMDMKLNLETPIIVLKPTPTSTEYMEIRLGDLSITSERIKATDRFKNPTKPLEYVYTEKMNILLKDMCMYRVQGDQKFEMSSKVNFDLGMERPLFVDEYKLIYSEGEHITKTKFTLNAGMKLTGKMSPMILMLQHEDYLMVMRCLNFNIGYDDGQDKMFLSDYEAVVASQGKPGSPMDINLVFENFTLLACDKKNGLPFAMINLHSFRVNISRDENKNQDIQVFAKELNGSYFENEDNVTLIERKMLGALDRVDRFNIENVPKEDVVKEVVQKTSNYAQEISAESTSKDAAKDQLVVILQMQANGDKVIRVTVNELKMYLITSIYLSLLEFISMDASVYPPPREAVEGGAPAATEEKQIEAAKPEAAVKPEEPKHQPCMTVNLEVKNIIITMPSTISMTKDTPNVLALKGDISFVYATYPSPDLEESISDVKKRNFNRAVEQCAQFNEIGRISVTLHRLEIFVCEFADLLSSKNFNQVKKRNMILPFSLILVRKTHQVCNRQRTELINVTRNEVNIERLILRLSYQDVKLINNSISYQMEQLKQGQPEASPEEEAAKKKAEEEEKAKKAALETSTTSPSKLDESVSLTEPSLDKSVSTVSEKKEIFEESKEGDATAQNPAILQIKEDEEKAKQDDWTPNYEEFNVASKGIQVVIINDAEGSLVPVLEFTMFELLITMIKLPTKMKLSGRVVMNCSYFNPLPSKWEPFVERFGLDFDLTTQQESPKMSVVLSTSEGYDEINLNVSEQMLAILYSTSITWQEDFKQKKGALNRSKTQVVNAKDKEEDTIDYVSPYTIINNTGYDIEVQADFASMTARPSVARKSIQQSYRIANGGAAQYLVESDIDKIFERSMQDMFLQTNKIMVQIQHPDLKIDPITGIDIDKPRVRGYNLTGKDKVGKDLAGSNLQVFSSVLIDKSKKIITISSPYRIVNNVARNYLAVLEANGQTLEIPLAEGECSSIPLDFSQGTFALRIDEPGAVTSFKVPIKNFIGVDKVQEFQTGPTSFVAAKSAKVDQANDFYQITFLPPFEVKNCCGLDLFYRFSDNKETAYEMSALRPQETLHETKLGIKQPIYIQIRLQGYYWSPKVLINSPDPKAKLSKEVQVKDATGNLLNILVFFPEGEVGSRKLFLYTKTCIINETPYDILCYSMEDKKKVQIPGQLPTDSQEVFNNKITLYNETNSMTFSRRRQKEHSKTVNVGTMGSTAAELVNEAGTSMLDVGVNMSLKRCDKNYNLITKIITLSPRFILINKTDYKIQVKREDGEAILETLEKEVRTPLYWSDWTANTKAKSISIRPLEDESNPELWNWSNGFDIQAVGLYNYFIKSGDKSQTKFLKTSVTLEHSSLFVVIEEEKLEQLAYKIRNECATVDILVYQNGDNSSNGYLLKNGQTIPWAWNYPNKKKEVAAAYTVDAAKEYHGEDCNYSFDTLNTIVKTKVPAGGESIVRVYSTVIVEGSTRVLKFFQPNEIKLDKKKTFLIVNEGKESKPAPVNPSENVINMNVEIAIKGLGISIISSLSSGKEKKIKQRREVLYILVRGIEFRMVDSTQLKSSQVRIKYLNIDNNTSYDTSFPVLLTPTKPKDLKAGTKNYFLDALIAQKVTPEVTFYETIQFLLDASTLKVDGMFIDSMMEVANNFSSIFSSNEGADGKGTIAQILYSNPEAAQKLENKDYFVTKFDWLYTPISEFAGGNLYIKKLVLNALLFNISFQLKKKDTAEDAFFLLNLLTSVLGTALANLDSAPLTLNGIVLENVFDSKEAITKKIVDKYKDEVTRSIPKLLGSLDIVGNPVGLFTNISSGVVDLFEKPAQGFLQGPLEGGKGILEGAGSLMKNTVSGTFNSIGKVTGSLASGLSNLTMDDEYMAQREKSKMRRPKHLGEGVVQGVTSIFKGVGEGVTGVFTKPIEGASKGGLKGFFKGAFQGVTGLVVKPVTGVLDAAANTAEGIKNTATAFDQKPNENRERYPRAFYGEEKYYRTYMDSDAEVMWLIYFSETAPPQYKQCSMLNSFDVFPDEKEKEHFYILVISLEYIIWWSVKSGNIKWAVETSNIDKMNAFNDGMVIYLKKATEQVKDKTINIKNCDPQQNAFIYKKLTEVVEYTKQK